MKLSRNETAPSSSSVSSPSPSSSRCCCFSRRRPASSGAAASYLISFDHAAGLSRVRCGSAGLRSARCGAASYVADAPVLPPEPKLEPASKSASAASAGIYKRVRVSRGATQHARRLEIALQQRRGIQRDSPPMARLSPANGRLASTGSSW